MFFSCNSISIKKSREEHLKVTDEKIEKVSFLIDVVLDNWRNDYTGCLGYRTLESATSIVNSISFSGKSTSFIIESLGEPNKVHRNKNSQNLYYYFNVYCEEGKFNENFDFCWLELKTEYDKVIVIDISCK